MYKRQAVQISSANGVTVSGNPWYVQLHVQENSDKEQTIQELTEAYPGKMCIRDRVHSGSPIRCEISDVR